MPSVSQLQTENKYAQVQITDAVQHLVISVLKINTYTKLTSLILDLIVGKMHSCSLHLKCILYCISSCSLPEQHFCELCSLPVLHSTI